MDDDDSGGSDATAPEPLTQAETRADDDARASSPRVVIRVVGGPEQWGDVTRPTDSPASPADRLPPFDVSFFDAAPPEPSQVTRAQLISVTTGREDTQSYGDLVGEPGRDGDELVASPTPNVGVAPVVDPLAAIGAASSGSHPGEHLGSGSPANTPPQTSPTLRRESNEHRRRRRMLAVGPIAVLVAAVAGIVLLAGPSRPKLGSTPSTTRRHPASSTPTPTRHAMPAKATAPSTTKPSPTTSASTTSTTAVPGALMPASNTSTSAATQGQLPGLLPGGSGATAGGSTGSSAGGSSQPAGPTGAPAGGSTYVAPSIQGGGGGHSSPSPPSTSSPTTTVSPSTTPTQNAPVAGCDNPILCQ